MNRFDHFTGVTARMASRHKSVGHLMEIICFMLPNAP